MATDLRNVVFEFESQYLFEYDQFKELLGDRLPLGFFGTITSKFFTLGEVEKATNNFRVNRIIGEGSSATVYKGVLPDNTVVAVKKFTYKCYNYNDCDDVINEMAVAYLINHINLVRFLGCCLEAEVPVLVFEYIPNGTLYEHIHRQEGKGPLSLELRLKIALETAGALAYLHSLTPKAIIHRDVKTTNILLDDNYTAKLMDYECSRLLHDDADQVSTLVRGTLGYLDPQYLQSHVLTKKSDVYSFGVVLAELLTSQRALSSDRDETERNLASFFISSMKEDRLNQILDGQIIVNEESFETANKAAHLAERCLRIKGEERPSMKQVAVELEGILRNFMAVAEQQGGEPSFS